MFVGKLNEAQRRSFMALVMKMALADAQVKPEEVDVLEEFSAVFGPDLKIPPEEIYGATNVDAFDTRESQVIALLGMLVVAFSDKHFHVDESTVLTDAAAAFGITGPELLKMKTWAERAARLYGEFTALRTAE